MKTINISLLTFILLLIHCLSTQATVHNLNQPSGNFSVEFDDYVDDMNEIWNINIGTNKPVQIYYSIDTEDSYDYLTIFSVDNAGNSTAILSVSGLTDGTISTVIPSGKAKIVFTTDGSCCYSDCGYTGIYGEFSADNSYTVTQNSYSTGNSIVAGNLGVGVTNPLEKIHVNGAIRGNSLGGALKVKTDYGYLELGPMSSGYAHLYTDKPNIAFNKPVCLLTGQLGSIYNQNLSFMTTGNTRMTILNSNGNVGIGAVIPRAKLHINNGNNSDAAILATASEGNNLVVSSINTSVPLGTVFRISHEFQDYQRNNGYISFHRGGSSLGGFLEFGTNGLSRMLIDTNGNVGIGTATPQNKLDVKGIIRATEVKVVSIDNFPDYVFEGTYKLPALLDVNKYIQTKGHLPGMPTAAEAKENGIGLADMQMKLLQKIEELTLYVIDQQKEIEALKNALKESKK